MKISLLKPLLLAMATLAIILLISPLNYGQAFLNADATGDAYARIQSKGFDYEVPDCVHPVRHIFEQYDSTLKKNVFAFNIHRSVDNDRCINFDRQRVEIKTWDGSPDSMKGFLGDTMVHRWKFKLDAAFQPSTNFSHIHQIKAGDGTYDTDNPIITLTARLSSPNRLELNFVTPVESGSITQRLATMNLAPFLGTWVEAYEKLTYGPNGKYSLILRRISDDSLMLNYSNTNIALWRTGITFVRPKFGIYRSLLDSVDLRDETLLFADFIVQKGATLTVPNAPTGLSVAFPAFTSANLSWIDGSNNEIMYRVDRSPDGVNYYYNGFNLANLTTSSDTGLTQSTTYYYRVRAENATGNSGYASYTLTTGGNWSAPASWSGGVFPTASTDVTISASTPLVLDVSGAACKNLTVNGTLTTLNTAAVDLTVNGNLLINPGGSFTSPSLSTGSGNIFHTLTIYGDFTNAGGTFDFRMGSAGSTLRAINTSFVGSSNATITVGPYSSTNNDFNSITINKTGGAKVICGSDVSLNQGATSGVSQLILTSGLIETGNYSFNVLSTTGTDIVNPSATSYVNGSLGRGMSNSGGTTRLFPVGDANAYRPISIKSTTGGSQSTHYCTVRCITANANLVNSTYSGGIDLVSMKRYFQLSYFQGLNGGASTMSFSQFIPSYGNDDGVTAGNTDLRVAYSPNSGLAWVGMTQSAQTTSLTSPPVSLTPNTLASPLTLNSGSGSILISLARASGTNTNTLPVELTSFSGTAAGRDVKLHWTTATENNSSVFQIERRSPLKNEWALIGQLDAAGMSNTPREYTFLDKALLSASYDYRLKIINDDGSFSYSVTSSVVVELPRSFQLQQNYPNPFNPSTTISFSLPAATSVLIVIFNQLGEQVATLQNGEREAGYHSLRWDAGSLPSGIYFCSMRAGNFGAVRKLLLVK
jgi:hypothetical protein